MEQEENKTRCCPVCPMVIIIIILALAAVGAIFWWQKYSNKLNQTACTKEAMLCPDGTAVGRTGPNCEFVPCPTPTGDEIANWKTYRNEEYGFEVKYPKEWYIQFEISSTSPELILASEPKEMNAHGVGLPSGGMWISVTNICNKTTTDFEYEGPKPDIWERWSCQNNFQTVIGYWPRNASRVPNNETILNQIISTFKFTK